MSKLRGHFLNTRPTDRAEGLTALLTAAGWQVTALPLLALEPLHLSPEALEMVRSLSQSAALTVVVVVSPTAAQLGLAALRALSLDPQALPVRWLAVGEGTAQVLAAVGVIAETPLVASSEGLMDTDLLRQLQPQDRVQVWRGLGGRALIQESLLARGVRLQVLNLYRRQLPKSSVEAWNRTTFSVKTAVDVKKNDSHSLSVVLLSSGESWRHWQTIAGQDALVPWLLVLGPRLMAELQTLTPRVKALTSLQPEQVLRALTEIEDTYAG